MYLTIRNTNIARNLRTHASILQSSVSMVSPTHSFPPPDGGGELQALSLDRDPPEMDDHILKIMTLESDEHSHTFENG